LPVNPLQAQPLPAHGSGMTDKDKQREERLATALRENLRKRKAQARTLSERPTKDDDQP